MILIHTNIFILRDYFLYTIENMNHVIQIASNLGTYHKFVEDMESNKHKLEKLCNIFSKIKPFKISLGKMMDIGKIMKLNYEIFVDNDMKECVDYSFGFNSFYEHVDHLSVLINEGKINYEIAKLTGVDSSTIKKLRTGNHRLFELFPELKELLFS